METRGLGKWRGLRETARVERRENGKKEKKGFSGGLAMAQG